MKVVVRKKKEAAWAPRIPPKLTPSHHGEECLGNGDWPGYECCCDECDHFDVCFPEFQEQLHETIEETKKMLREIAALLVYADSLCGQA